MDNFLTPFKNKLKDEKNQLIETIKEKETELWRLKASVGLINEMLDGIQDFEKAYFEEKTP